jgi:ferredoxin
MIIGVIGSGPVGAASALTFLRAGFSVRLFDLGYEKDSELDIGLLQNKRFASKLKLFNGNAFPYDLDQFNQVEDLGGQKSWFASKGLGGFSTIWGATWKPFDDLISPEWESAFNLASKMVFERSNFEGLGSRFSKPINVSEVCSCFDMFAPQEYEAKGKIDQSWKLKISESSLAVFINDCIVCGDCQVGCPTNAIWSSLNLLQKCKSFKGFELFINCFVESYFEVNERVALKTNNGVETLDYLFIAAGPIPTASIILRSEGSVGSVSLSDTRMITIPFFKIRATKAHSGAFTLSGRNVNFLSVDKHEFQLQLQLYAHIDEFIPRIQSQFPKYVHGFLKYILVKLRSRLFIGLLYVDSRISGTLKCTFSENLISEPIDENLIFRSLATLKGALKNLRKKFGLWPIWRFAKFGAIGDSYHLGNMEGLEISSYGEVGKSNKIYVVGAAGLPMLEPGPITMSAMAHGIRSALKLIESLPKS